MDNTIFDGEIAELENHRKALEGERQRLMDGQLTINGPDGNTVQLNLGTLPETGGEEIREIEKKLQEALIENPLVTELATSFKKRQEWEEEILPDSGIRPLRKKTASRKLLLNNRRLNLELAKKNKFAGRLISSGWLLVLGVILLLTWGGGPLLYRLTGGAIGGVEVVKGVPGKGATGTIKADSNGAGLQEIKRVTPGAIVPSETSMEAKIELEKAEKVNLQVASFKNKPLFLTEYSQSPGCSEKKEPITTPSPDRNPEKFVRQTSSSAGGLNGPHGAFFAPSRMEIGALGLDTTILRAITGEAVSGVDEKTGKEEITLLWPVSSEVVHFGAYPGELGNMVILGNQKNLAMLRRLQQNDEIRVTDRKGNIFTYRALPFSPEGQPERVVDPNQENWIFSPTPQAVLTIVISMPSLVQPDQAGKNPTANTPPPDDFSNSKKLAYRGVLVLYQPKDLPSQGTPVEVPPEVWETKPYPLVAGTPPPVPTTAPPSLEEPAPPITVPLLPNTGGGGGGFLDPANVPE